MTRNGNRTGQTMLELIAATVIISVALVPAMKVTRKCIFSTAELEQAEARLTLCTGKLEEQLAATVATWDLTSLSGTLTAPGGAEVHYTVTKSDSIAAGGIPDALAAIEVVVWDDVDGDRVLGSGEHSVKLATKVAKLVSYEEDFNGE